MAFMPAEGKRGAYLFFYEATEDRSYGRPRGHGTATPGLHRPDPIGAVHDAARPRRRMVRHHRAPALRSGRSTRRRTSPRSGSIRSASCSSAVCHHDRDEDAETAPTPGAMIALGPQEDRPLMPRVRHPRRTPAARSAPRRTAQSRVRAIQGLGQDMPRLAGEAAHHLRHRPAPPRPRATASYPWSTLRASRRWTQLVRRRAGMSQWNTVEVCPVRPGGRHAGRTSTPSRSSSGSTSVPPGDNAGLRPPARAPVRSRRCPRRCARSGRPAPPGAAPTTGMSLQRDVRVHLARRRLDVDVQVHALDHADRPRRPRPSARAALPSPRASTRTFTRDVRDAAPVRQLAEPHVARRRLDLDLAGRRPHLEVARGGGEDGAVRPRSNSAGRPRRSGARTSPPTAPMVMLPLAVLAVTSAATSSVDDVAARRLEVRRRPPAR